MAESRWSLNDQGAIVEVGVRQLPLGGGELKGRSCAEVVRGTDERGAPVCARCPVVARLRRGAYTAETTLVADGCRLRCTATVTQVGTEVRLSTQTRPDSAEVLLSLARAVDRMRDRTQLFPTLQRFLEVLRRASAVDAVEVFLAAPERAGMLLALHCGSDVAAFQERAVFRIGEGFPGIVADEGTPLCTHDLASDDRYLRGSVKRLGYRTFLSYPLRAAGGFVGALDLASHEPDVDDRSMFDLLATIGPVLASALYGALSELSEQAVAEVVRALRSGQPAVARGRMFRLTEEVSGARTVDLVSPERPQPGTAANACPVAEGCPVLRGELHAVGVPGMECPLGERGVVRYCLPWRLGEAVVGVQRVELAQAPAIASQYVAPLLWLHHRAGQLLGAVAGDLAWEGRETPRLVIRAFGAFQVSLDGRPLDPRSLGRRKAWLLLKLLVAQRGHVLAREELAEQLWPGDDPVAAVKRVHVLVSTLRKAIEASPQQPAVILSEGDGYTFSPLEPVDLDVVTFERLLDEADLSEGAAAIRGYVEALRLYSGDFMAEEVYDDGFELDRAYFRERAASALLRCASLQEALGRLGDAIVSLRRVLQGDPWHDPARRELARLLEQRGDGAQAARVLEQGARLLAGEP